MNSFETLGLWWLPDTPDIKISGTLSFSPDTGGNLSLFGSLNKSDQFGLNHERITIHGISQSGKEYTLLKCLNTSSSFNLPGIPTYEYNITTILEGNHFLDEEEIKFDSFRIYFSNLEDWLNQKILFFTQTIEPETNKQRYTVEYEPEQLPQHSIEGMGTIKFLYNHHSHYDPVHVIHNFSATTEFFVEFTPDSPASLEKILNYYSYHFCNFLSLAIQKPSYPLRFVGYISSHTKQIEDKQYPIPIEIFQDLIYCIKEQKRVQPYNLLFSFREIHQNFSDYYKNWVNFSEIHKPSVDLFFSLQHHDRIYLEDSFQKIIQALEAYHRRSPDYQKDFCSPEEFESLKATFLDCIPEDTPDDFKNSMKTKISYFYQYSLQRRLKEILKTCKNDYGPIILEIFGNIPEWAYNVANRRDHFTHHEQDEELDHRELFLWIIQGKLLFHIIFLREIGFDKEFIIQKIKSDDLYKQLKRGGGFIG
ncbi:MAG: hypothetical protein PHR06_09970 [Candidatus Cloacimonetes bacterium]|nr:hypothetical protein [Candidatus Cloacimonadota bacterium]